MKQPRAIFSMLAAIILASGLTALAHAQTPAATPAPNPPAAGAANAADVATLDSTIAALYDVISGPPGARNWDRFRSLFIPGARLIPTGRRQTGEVASRVLSPDEYVQRSSPVIEKNGFFEREVSRHTEQFGNIAHIFSTYESRHAKDDAQPLQRGINSIQMMNDGTRWWIVTIFWQGEDDRTKLPSKYLSGKN